jgi:hypothetical protein
LQHGTQPLRWMCCGTAGVWMGASCFRYDRQRPLAASLPLQLATSYLHPTLGAALSAGSPLTIVLLCSHCNTRSRCTVQVLQYRVLQYSAPCTVPAAAYSMSAGSPLRLCSVRFVRNRAPGARQRRSPTTRQRRPRHVSITTQCSEPVIQCPGRLFVRDCPVHCTMSSVSSATGHRSRTYAQCMCACVIGMAQS